MGQVFGLATGLALLLLACGGQSSEPELYVQPDDSGLRDGKSVYADKCTVCHGADGKKGISGATDLSSSTLALAGRIDVITNGRNSMVGWKGVLTEKEIKAVAEYLEELRPQP